MKKGHRIQSHYKKKNRKNKQTNDNEKTGTRRVNKLWGEREVRLGELPIWTLGVHVSPLNYREHNSI